jgi:hypothetical protein
VVSKTNIEFLTVARSLEGRQNRTMTKLILIFAMTGITCSAWAAELLTNAAHFADAPAYVTSTRVNKIADKVQNVLEWTIRRVEVEWYKDQASFDKVHKLGPMAVAVSLRDRNRILLGPRITTENFESVFGHELVHVISYQKYKDAIPRWLEEGLANHVAQTGRVDYKWLRTQPLPKSVTDLIHPFDGTTDRVRYHYAASQALAELISSKCELRGLLRLSVGRKLEDYLENICRIKDLNAEFAKWIKSK